MFWVILFWIIVALFIIERIGNLFFAIDDDAKGNKIHLSIAYLAIVIILAEIIYLIMRLI